MQARSPAAMSRFFHLPRRIADNRGFAALLPFATSTARLP